MNNGKQFIVNIAGGVLTAIIIAVLAYFGGRVGAITENANSIKLLEQKIEAETEELRQDIEDNTAVGAFLDSNLRRMDRVVSRMEVLVERLEGDVKSLEGQ